MKKLVIGLAVLVMSALGVLMLPAQSVYASDCDGGHFLGLPAWYDGLTEKETNSEGVSQCVIKTPAQDANGDDVKAYVWTIVLNIMGLITGLIGYIAIGFVIWGGILYMIAQGDPGKIAKGKKTIQNSIIGLIISMTASILSGAIASVVASAKSAAGTDGKEFFQTLFNKVFLWSGIVAVIMIVYGGIQYTTSAGNSAGVAKAKSTILYSIVGLLVVILAAAIVNVVIGAMPD